LKTIDGKMANTKTSEFNLSNPVFEHAKSGGSRLAVHAAGVDVTYSEFSELGQRIATWLTKGPEREPGFVGILASRSAMAYAGVLGTCWAGDAYVPLNPKLPEERLAQLIDIIKPVALVADAAGMKALTGRARQAAPARVLTSFDELGPHDSSDRPREVGSEDTAYMIFTSGSTGVPKGVLVPNRAVVHLVKILQEIYEFSPSDRFSKAYNLSFDGSVHDMFTAWNAGASLNAVPASQLTAPLKFIQERQLTVWTSVPSTAVFMERMKMLQAGSMPSLRVSIFSGEPLPVRSALEWQKAAPNSLIDNICGHTECCVFSTLERLTDPPHVTPNRGLVAIGKPLPGLEAAVFDENCNSLPANQQGELALAGPQVAKGYFQDPERTAARFPKIGGKVWYRTGDLVYLDETGIYHHLGRIDNQVKIRGHRIELGEVEAHLAVVCGSDSVATVAWPTDHGSARGIVAFHCVPGITAKGIQEALTKTLPPYEVPYIVRKIDTIPLTENGKVDRRALIEMLEREAGSEVENRP
jgi:amino acid adenylation domain-containing protein